MQDGIILVVEDDPTLQLSMKMVLEHLGYNCKVVSSGEDAMPLDYDGISLIFMDVGLPGIQGGELTLLIREKESRENLRRMPIVGLTGHAVRDLCLESGMDDFLQKPAMMQDLKSMIEKWAGRR